MANRKRNGLIVGLAILLVLVLAFGGVLIGFYASDSRVLKDAPTLLKGNLPDNPWANTDAFDFTQYPNLQTDDGSLKVLQLTDLHYKNQGTFGAKVGMNVIMDGVLKKQIKRLVKEETPDLIVITGDLITYQAADVAYRELVEFFDSLLVPYTVAFGNHDAEYNTDKAALCEILATGKNSAFLPGPTNLVGLGNQVITVSDKNGALTQALVLLDSNDCVLKNVDASRQFSTYDAGVYPQQVAWYEWVVDSLKAANGGNPLLTSVYYHIQESSKSWQTEGSFLNAVLTKDSTKYIFFGDSHAAGSTVKENGVVLTNGVKAGINYKEDPMTGGTAVLTKKDGSAVIRHIHSRTKSKDKLSYHYDSEQNLTA